MRFSRVYVLTVSMFFSTLNMAYSAGFQMNCAASGASPVYTAGYLQGVAQTQILSQAAPGGAVAYSNTRSVDGHFVIYAPDTLVKTKAEVIHLTGTLTLTKYYAHGLYANLVGTDASGEALTLTGEIYYNHGTKITWKGRQIFVPCTFQWVD